MSLTVTPAGGGGISASSADTLTNKTINANSNTLLNLSATSVKDGTDTTKILNFDVSGFSTATTRTLTPAAAGNSVTVIADAGSSNNFLTGITTAGAITKAQPTVGNISGAAASGANSDITALGGLTGTTTSAQGTIAANTPAFAITQTWNNAAISFMPLTIAITDTASTGSASGFVNFTKGGASQFSVNKSGVVSAITLNATGVPLVGGAAGSFLVANRLYASSGETQNIGSPGLTNTVILDGSINKVNTPFTLKGYTVGTLPTGTVGDMAYVTNALAPTYNAAVVAGGGITVPVFYNGSAWVSH